MKPYYPVVRVFGVLLAGFALTMLVPWCYSYLSEDGAQSAYDEALLVTFGTGVGLWWAARKEKSELKVRDGFLMVVMVWSLLPVFACLPLIFQLHISFTDAYFEAMSGLTTTGATVFSSLDTLPPSINLWRGMLVWLGGMGLIVLALAVLPLLGIGGRQMFKAETPGPMKDSSLTPRMAETAKGLWVVYGVVTVLCILSLRWAGMSWFDAVMHSFTTMGLGGFSSHDASFGHWNSPLIETVTVVFMLIAGMNFATLFLAVRGRSLLPYAHDPEARYFLGVTLASVIGIAIYLEVQGVYPDFGTAFRHALFNVVLIATTTGFASVDYNAWPIFAPLWMLFLCSFATSAGSTGGGIKMVRMLILFKQAQRELTRLVHPNAVQPVRLGGRVVGSPMIFSVLAFMLVYAATLLLLSMVLLLTDLDPVTAFSAVMASLHCTGPGLGAIGPTSTYAVLTDFQVWVCTLAMVLGRLEILSFLALLTPAFWRR